MEYGIKETKELLDFGFKLQDAIVAASEDGTVNFADLPTFFPPLMASPKAFGGIQGVGAELVNLDAAEKEELLAFARERFEIDDEGLEMLIEDTLAEVLDLVKLGGRWAKYRKPIAE